MPVPAPAFRDPGPALAAAMEAWGGCDDLWVFGYASLIWRPEFESAEDRPGSAAIIDRLAEVLFVQAMRSQVQATLEGGSPSWIRGLADPQIGESLRLMHAEPGRAWTVTDLADRVAMSRSAFAARFRDLVG